jgi:outer membrane immunogenic protein
MKKIALSVAALALTAGSALAADLPSRKAPPAYIPPPPPPLWTGFYVGLNAGGTWAASSSINTVASPVNPFPGVAFTQAFSNALAASAFSTVSNSNGGFIGGGQVGYNYQFYNSFLVGLEADIQGIAGSKSNQTVASGAPIFPFADNYVAASSARRSVDYLGTVRGRLGWLATPTLLLYGTGGLAYGGVNLNTAYIGNDQVFGGLGFANPVFGASAYSNTRVGWTAGAGVEWMFLPNWSAKVEYLYYDLGSVTTNGGIVHTFNGNAGVLAGVPFAGAITQTTARFDGHIVRAGVNYHFNWGAPAPVVAKY